MKDNELHGRADNARHEATRHRKRAGELYAEHRRDGKEETLAQANQENAKAAAWENTAGQSKQQVSGNEDKTPQKEEDTFSKDGEAAGNSSRRAWFEPGTVADDKLLQLDEAKQGGLMEELTKYAARSVFDKEHRDFQGAKMAGKAAAAPVKAVGSVGKTTAKGMGAAAKGVGAVARASKSTGRAILESAAGHTTNAVGGKRQSVLSQIKQSPQKEREKSAQKQKTKSKSRQKSRARSKDKGRER